ncbi:uncharacterized protein LOC133723533 [Rosa rugosa]|uniref:uncharacterized protein LOC133723533 n=1 Tax=Rosa rugosa TaxID=74645 RepID=UPI002B400637|nr:uncharacterized protein LOC133723533 [Rosa rugosa]
MARIRKHGANFSGEGGVESVDDSDAVVGEGLEEGGELVDGGGDSGGKVGPVDMEIDEKGGDGVTEGLEGTQFGGTDVNAASEKGSVSESKDGSKGVESSVFSDKDRGKDEILGECVEAEVVGAVEGNLSVSFEAKEDGTVEGKDELMRDDKEEEVAQVDEEERGREQNVERSQVGEKSAHATSSNVEHEATGSVGEIPQDIPAVEVKIAGIDESGHDGDLNASTGSQMVMSGGLENQTLEVNVGVKTGEDVLMPEYVSPAEVSVKSENGHNLIDMAIDLEPYAGKDGNVSDDSNVSGPSQPEFQAFDLVWGKIRSHPWWPGQICDPSASSKLAKKYFKKHSYLIAYFWDCTFAWNEAPQIKPFRENFSQMEKQSNMEEFQNAVACALDEVSRRVEFGLACSCISKEVYAKIKTQTIINAGIKEAACRRDGGDSSLGAASFVPLKLINFAKEAAKLPFGRADRLELVTSRAQLSSFYRWKGYSQLPEFNFLGGLLENDADISLLREKEQFNELREDALPVIKDEELEQKSKGKSSSLHKRKHISGDSSRPSKKGKNSSNVTAEKGLSTPMSKNGSERKADCKLVSQSSSKKRKAVDGAMSDDSAVKHSKSASSAGEDYVSLQNKQTFRVGDRICRVATLLNGSSPIFRHNAAPADAEVQDEGKEKSTSQKPQTEKLIDMEDPSPDEMLSQLCLAAMNPNKGYSMLISLMGCFSKFRNTICLEPPSPDEDQLPLGQIFGGKHSKKLTKTGKKSIKPRISEKSELELVKDSYSSDKMVKSQSENGELLLGAASDKDTCVVESQSSPDSEAVKPVLDNKNGELVCGTATSDKDTSTVELQASLELNPTLDSEQNIVCGDIESKAVNTAATSDKDTSTVELQATLELNPNLDSEQNIVCGDIDSKAVNPALDDENGALVREPISFAESSADPKSNPNLDFEQENTVGDTGAEAVKPALDNESGELVAGALSNKDASAEDSQASLEFNPNMDSALKFPDGDHDSEAVKPASPSESCEEDSPAALILNFSDLESLPSEASLNKIFSIFGPLNESQTELLKNTNRAKVVFRRRSDAQKAFSSAGKYSTFGPSLESYRLKYPLSPSKASPSLKVAKQGKMDASAEGDGARKH